VSVVLNFDSIAPNEVDRVAFDFTAEIGATGSISAVTWTCEVAADSPVGDLDASTRIISVDPFTNYKTSALVGTMINGVIYQLQALVEINDGRILAQVSGITCAVETLPDIASQPVDSQVFFNYQLWLARYPEFSTVPELTALQYFAEATLYLRNDGSGPVTDNAEQLRLLGMLTAHIATLYGPSSAGGSAGSPIVGPITSASEGSVSISGQALFAPGTAAWFGLTRYGAAFWLATAAYRTFRYRPGFPRQFNPPFFRLWPGSSF